MEELLVEGQMYIFKIANDKSFTARFNKIDYPDNTLFVSDYTTNELGHLIGIRSMPFRWIKHIEIIDKNMDISLANIELIDKSIELSPKSKKQTKNKCILKN